MMLSTYQSARKNENLQSYEEFSEAISETKKILMKHFSRTLFEEKGDEELHKAVKGHLKFLIQQRVHIFNVYFFANPRSNEPSIGYKVLQKYAFQSGIKNPDAITCTRLIKYLVTMAQLFSIYSWHPSWGTH
nr:unnamed protein product [Callosobruchus analis]